MTIVADLHTHTTVTDGRISPGRLLAEAAEAGLRHLVITDHSRVTTVDPAPGTPAAGVEQPFPGVEVSTFLGGLRHHVLVYGPGLRDPGFQTFLSRPVDWKNELAAQVHAALRADGYRLPDLDTIRANGGVDGAPTPEKEMLSRSAIAHHLARASSIPLPRATELVRTVHRRVDDRDRDDPGRLARRYLPTLDVLDAAATRGLTTSLAHPAWQCADGSDLDRVVAEVGRLVEHGLAGMETRSYHHRPFDDHPALLSARVRYGLLRTGGSDYHANGRTTLGSGGLDEEAFGAFAALVTARAASAVSGG